MAARRFNPTVRVGRRDKGDVQGGFLKRRSAAKVFKPFNRFVPPWAEDVERGSRKATR